MPSTSAGLSQIRAIVAAAPGPGSKDDPQELFGAYKRRVRAGDSLKGHSRTLAPTMHQINECDR